jgi:hypothetical protein
MGAGWHCMEVITSLTDALMIFHGNDCYSAAFGAKFHLNQRKTTNLLPRAGTPDNANVIARMETGLETSISHDSAFMSCC